MRNGRRTSQTARGAIVVACVLLIAGVLPASAEETTIAAVNGVAEASAAFVPAAVNPNLDFWPVYSLSEIDGDQGHGLSAGFWPGFLLDAFAFSYGYQPGERAAFGVAESLYPQPPNADAASTADFAEMCAAGQVTTVPLPFEQGSAGFPEPLMTGCQSLYTQYRSYIPYKVAAASAESDALRTVGDATGEQLVFGPVRIGAAYTTSATNAIGGTRVESISSVLLSDVQIGEQLRIKFVRGIARAVTDGTKAGTKIERELTIVDATLQGQPVTIDESEIGRPDAGPVNEALAREGIQVRIVGGQGTTAAGRAQVTSGALVVRMTRPQPHPALTEDTDERCNTIAQAQPSPVATVTQSLGPNPLYDDVPPYDQLPPEVGIEETVPPALSCPLLLFDRAVDVGVALGGAKAAARYQRLPAPPGFDDDFGSFDGDFGGGFGTGSGPSLPGGSGGPILPDFSGTPPVPRETIVLGELLGAGVAEKVRVLYAGMALLLAMTLIGRRVFRQLTRA